MLWLTHVTLRQLLICPFLFLLLISTRFLSLISPLCAFKGTLGKMLFRLGQGGGWGEGTMKWSYFCCLLTPKLGSSDPSNCWKNYGLINSKSIFAPYIESMTYSLRGLIVMLHKSPLDTWPRQLRRNMRSANIRVSSLCLHNVDTYNNL